LLLLLFAPIIYYHLTRSECASGLEEHDQADVED
jgi:hypothetical protein